MDANGCSDEKNTCERRDCERLHVSGASIPGIPFVFVGRNQQVSWGMTQATAVDTEDLFVDINGVFERPITAATQSTTLGDVGSEATPKLRVSTNIIHSAAAAAAAAGSGGAAGGGIHVREELIKVRGESEPRVHFACDTSYGPMISNHFSPAVRGSLLNAQFNWRDAALSSQALRQSLSLRFLKQLNQAATFEEFTAAAGEVQFISLDLAYADVSGNIGLVRSGRYDALC